MNFQQVEQTVLLQDSAVPADGHVSHTLDINVLSTSILQLLTIQRALWGGPRSWRHQLHQRTQLQDLLRTCSSRSSSC